MSKLTDSLIELARAKRLRAIVLDYGNGYATLRTTRGSAILKAVRVVGGGVNNGDIVNVKWDGTSPYVEATDIPSEGGTIVLARNRTASRNEPLEDTFSLGGWRVDQDGNLVNGDVIIDPDAQIILGTGNNIIYLSAINATARIWAGNTTPALAPFRVTPAGILYATGAVIDGEITAVTGEIGGWTIGANSLYSGSVHLDSSVPSIRLGATAYLTGNGVWMGLDAAVYKFRVGDPSANRMVWDGTNLVVVGNITATTGLIGGWSISSSAIYKGTDIIISSTTPSISGGGYVAGQQGFYIDGNYAEFGNARIRGTLTMAVFEANYIQATAGDFGVFRSAGKLTANVTLGGIGSNGTINLEDSPNGYALYEVDSILRFKDPPSIDAWIEIDTVGLVNGNGRDYVYTVLYNGSVTLRVGMTCVDYGKSGYGFLLMSASDLTTSPWLALYKHTGTPWTTTTLLGKIGKFVSEYGFTGYGFAFGDSTLAGNYIKYDGTNLTLSGGITASSGSFSGVLSIGVSGGIYQGTGTFASPTTGLKMWNDSGIGRIGGYNASVLQWYGSTDGKLYAGAGNVVLDSGGINIVYAESVSPQDSNALRFKTPTGVIASGIYPYINQPLNTLLIKTVATGVYVDPKIILEASSGGSGIRTVLLSAAGQTPYAQFSVTATDIFAHSLITGGPLGINYVPQASDPYDLIVAGAIKTNVNGSTGGIFIGDDAQIYRSAANVLYTPDSLTIAGSLSVAGGSITLGGDTSLFRQAADVLRTNDNLEIYGGRTLDFYHSDGTHSGEIYCDATWLRFNQTITKNVYTLQMFRADGGIASGSLTPTSGKIAAATRFQRGGLDVYTYVQLTHTYDEVFNQAVSADTDYNIDLSDDAVPSDAELVHVRLVYLTSGATMGYAGIREYGQSSGTTEQLVVRAQVQNIYNEVQGFVAFNGTYIALRATQAGTAIVRLLGYFT